MQDWRVRNGRLECFVAGGDRHVYLLICTLRWPRNSFRLPVFREGVCTVRLLDERGNIRREWAGLHATSAHPV
jgi:hypothetical protein